MTPTNIPTGSSRAAINALIAGAPDPETFDWDAGTYRMAGGDMTRRSGDIHRGAGVGLTILSGAIDVSAGWVLDTGNWKKTGITQRSSDFDHGGFLGLSGWNGGTGNTNAAQKPELLYFDKVLLHRVNQLAAVSGGPVSDPIYDYEFEFGTWWFDEATNTIWVGEDPAGHTIEFGYENRLCNTTSDVTFEDMTVEGFACRAQTSPIPRAITDQTLTRMEFRLNHGYGWGIGTRTIATDVVSHHNGQMGMGGIGNNHVLTRCDFHHNNILIFNQYWEAGGYKIVLSNDGLAVDCASWENMGVGHWYDIDNLRNVHRRCMSRQNSGHGYSIEIGWEHLLEHCVALGDSWDRNVWLWGAGMLCQNSTDVTFREVYLEQISSHPFTGAFKRSDGLSSIQQGRGSGLFGLYTVANFKVERCINDFVHNAGDAGSVLDNGPPPETIGVQWLDTLWYGPSGFQNSGHWFPGGGGLLDDGAEWNAQAITVGPQTYRTGRAPRTASMVISSTVVEEADIIAGGLSFTVTMDEIETGFPDWLTDWFHGNIGDDLQLTADLLDGMVGSGGGANEWNLLVRPLLTFAHVTRTNDHEFVIGPLPAVAGYSTAGETVTFTLPTSCMVSRQTLAVDTPFDIVDSVTPPPGNPTLTLTGTAFGQDEIGWVDGALEVDFALTDETFVAAFDSFIEQDILDGIVAEEAEANGFNEVVMVLAHTVARLTATTARVTFLAAPGFNPTQLVHVNIALPATAVTGGATVFGNVQLTIVALGFRPRGMVPYFDD